MSLVQNVPAFSILLLMLCGIVCLVLPRRAARHLADCAIALVAAASVALLVYFLQGGAAYTYSMGEIGAPFGNELRAGMLEAAVATLFSIVTLLSLMGGRAHLRSDIGRLKVNLYYISTLFLLCSMLALVYTNDIFTAYVFVEINTITACGIVMSKEDGYTLAASMRYFIMSLIGSGLFLISICILYAVTGHLLMSNIQDAVAQLYAQGEYRAPLQVAIALMGVGLSLKSALWPFSSWLPDAHSSASASSSAMLSGLVLKSFIFLMIKIFYRVIGAGIVRTHAVLDLLLVFGILGMVMGSVNALFERDIKRLLAYSSVGQIGYIFCGVGLGTPAGVAAAMVQVAVHATTKAMLFCAAGGLMDASGGSKKFRDIEGAGRRDPYAGVAFIVGTLSMIGIPFFGGFITKLSLVQAAVTVGGWRNLLSILAIIVSTILTAIYYINVLAIIFRAPETAPTKASEKLKEEWKKQVRLDTEYEVAIVLFILLNLAIGLRSDQLMQIITTGLSMFG
ncbi:MAG: sodium:proton antiporter [Firmicutes bacterium]|nr:sodium:proton antiporter [Bacillota bacterium]